VGELGLRVTGTVFDDDGFYQDTAARPILKNSVLVWFSSNPTSTDVSAMGINGKGPFFTGNTYTGPNLSTYGYIGPVEITEKTPGKSGLTRQGRNVTLDINLSDYFTPSQIGDDGMPTVNITLPTGWTIGPRAGNWYWIQALPALP